jgi:hypothetical protein
MSQNENYCYSDEILISFVASGVSRNECSLYILFNTSLFYGLFLHIHTKYIIIAVAIYKLRC